MKKIGLVFCLLFTLTTGQANDSAGSVASGGIIYHHTPEVQMVSEHLVLTADRVSVTYQFKNTSHKDVHTTILFPLPPYRVNSSNESWDEEIGTSKDAPFKDFSVKVNGVPKDYKTITRALKEGKDVTHLLQGANIPLNTALAAGDLPLPEDKQQDLVKWQIKAKQLGLMSQQNIPKWEKQVVYSWEQDFPAGKTVVLTHTYKPAAGGFYLVADNRTPRQTMQEVAMRMKDLFHVNVREMIGNDSLENWVLAQKKTKTHDELYAFFRHVNYILTTGNNWSGPIAHFKLAIEYPVGERVIYNRFFEQGATVTTKPGNIEINISHFSPTKELQVVFASTKSPR